MPDIHPPILGLLICFMQIEDGVLLDGKLEEYQAAFIAVDTTGDGLLGACSGH